MDDAVLELTKQLIAIDSVSPTLAPGHAGEAGIVEAVASRLARADYRVDIVQSPDPARPSIVAMREGSQPGRSVVLNGHLDTVPVGGMDDPFRATIDGDRLSGRGASDMKGGVAGLIVAAEQLAAMDAPGRVILALVADEEDGSTGAEAVLERLEELVGTPDVCLIAEPTWLDVAEAHRGYELIRVDIAGRAAHSSQPAEAVDVVPVVSALLAAVLAADGRLASAEPDPQLDRGSLMTTVVRAGTAPFMVAASAELLIERRTLPTEPADVGSSEVEAIIAGLTVPDGCSVTAQSVIRRSAWQLAERGPSVELAELLEGALTTRGGSPARRGFPFWMESALWEEAGIPTVVFGPAGGGLHAVDEWVDLAQLRVYPGVVTQAVSAFLRNEDRRRQDASAATG
jgi:acetylornithine deacetylase